MYLQRTLSEPVTAKALSQNIGAIASAGSIIRKFKRRRHFTASPFCRALMYDHRSYPMEKVLSNARNHLFWCRDRLAGHRRRGQLNSNDRDMLRLAERDFLAALDLVWDVQCMSAGSL